MAPSAGYRLLPGGPCSLLVAPDPLPLPSALQHGPRRVRVRGLGSDSPPRWHRQGARRRPQPAPPGAAGPSGSEGLLPLRPGLAPAPRQGYECRQRAALPHDRASRNTGHILGRIHRNRCAPGAFRLVAPRIEGKRNWLVGSRRRPAAGHSA